MPATAFIGIRPSAIGVDLSARGCVSRSSQLNAHVAACSSHRLMCRLMIIIICAIHIRPAQDSSRIDGIASSNRGVRGRI